MFVTNLDIRLIGEYSFMLLEPLVYENSTMRITILKGFVCDGASIPKTFWSYAGCPFGGTYTRSAFLHDCVYKSHLLGKKESDDLFLEAMDSERVDLKTKLMLYGAVQEFGEWSYAHQPEIQKYRDFVLIEIKD